MNATKNKLNNM